MKKRFLVFDTETTGLLKSLETPLNNQPRIIELALVETDGKKILRKFSQLLSPGESLTAEITKITGLKDEDLTGKPTFAEVLPGLVRDWFLGAEGLIAHNLPFDHGMLLTELRRMGREHRFPWPPAQLCTVDEYLHIHGRRMRLTELYEQVIGKPLAQTHRALDDAEALTEIVIKSELLL